MSYVLDYDSFVKKEKNKNLEKYAHRGTFCILNLNMFEFTALVFSPTVMVVFLLVFLVGLLLFRVRDLPPGPTRIPVIGTLWWYVLQQLRGRRMPVALFEESRRHGDVQLYYVAGNTIVYLFGYDAIQEAFVKRADDFSGRPDWLFKDLPSHGIVFSNGTKWRAIRKFTLVALRDFGVGRTSLEEKIMREVDVAAELLRQNVEQPIEMRCIFHKMVTNIIFNIIFGKRLEYDSREFAEVSEKMQSILTDGAVIEPASLIPGFVWKLIGSDKRADAKATQKETLAWVFSYVAGQIEQHRDTFQSDHIRDFVDHYLLQEREDSAAGGKSEITKELMFGAIIDMFVAGTDTTANTLNWAVLFLQENPEVQRQCQAEIREKYGERQINWSDNGTLPYTEATILEIQRLGNIGPRMCLGTQLARMEMFLIITNLLQRFQFRREHQDVRHNLECTAGQLTAAPTPYHTRVSTCDV
ncbi:cytochrome P450 2B4-like isoform X2 [Mya arenaria]|uniref:cytochrome P450 2B4-like isoform X2 n=1 Tax=Mya arenaria TaxID=6604 RepID=UPI0022DEFD7A|nr:cytochrome P450 2B4-like isoform X2 [Mya arenaria]